MPWKIDISLPRPRMGMGYLRPTIKLIKRHHSRRPQQDEPRGPVAAAAMNNMDPDCAICSHPASHQCDCEGNALDKAVSQAETRMMANVFSEIRYVAFDRREKMRRYKKDKKKDKKKEKLTRDTAPGSAPTPKITSSNTSPCSPSAAKPFTPKK